MGRHRTYSYPPGEVVPLENLRVAFPDFDVKEGDFIKRDGKLFRVNSTGLQVDTGLWSFDSTTGEYLIPLKKNVAGHRMVLTENYASRLTSYQGFMSMARAQLIGASVIGLLFGVPLGAATLSLMSEGHTVGAACAALVVVFFGWVFLIMLRFYRRVMNPENVLGPQPLRRRSGGFGDAIPSPPAAPSAVSDDYQIPL